MAISALLFFLIQIPGGVIFDVTAGVYYWFLAGLVFLAVRLDRAGRLAALARPGARRRGPGSQRPSGAAAVRAAGERLKVLVTHPGRQHSHQAALALAEAGMLAGYWAGVPAVASHRRRVPAPLWRRFVRYAPVPLPAERVRWAPWVPALRRLGDLRCRPGVAAWTDFLACRLFDRWAAAPAAAGEGRRRGGLRDLGPRDLPAGAAAGDDHRPRRGGHPPRAPRTASTASPSRRRLHRRITAVKDAEIALADHVLTVSELARQSYVEAGVPAERVHCVPLGADVGLFAPAAERAPSGEGIDVRLRGRGDAGSRGSTSCSQAFARVRARRAGGAPAGDRARRGLLLPAGASAAGGGDGPGRRSPRRSWRRASRAADCLVLPSRNESFGMVVPEALAAGVPVLVSERVGAKDLVTDRVTGDRTGWIVPVEDVEALAGRMAWCARHPEELRRHAAAPAGRPPRPPAGRPITGALRSCSGSLRP